MPVHERAEADALHGAGHAQAGAHRGGHRPSADAGERVADEHVHDPGAAEAGEQHHDPLGLGGDLADARGPGPERMAAQGGDGGIGLVGRARRRRPCPRWPRTAGRCRAGRRRRSPPGRPAGASRRAPPPGRCRAPARCRRCRPRRGSGRAATECPAPRPAAPRPGRRPARCRSGCRPRGPGRRGPA